MEPLAKAKTALSQHVWTTDNAFRSGKSSFCWIKKESRSLSNKKLYRDYLHRIANFFVTDFNIFTKDIISNDTMWKQILRFILNNYIFPVFSLVSKIYFFEFLMFSSTKNWN